MIFNLPTPPNEQHQTKQKALKSKNDKIFKKMTKKKKCFYAIMLQIHFKCMKSLISNSILKGVKHEKTHPFISFRLAFSFHFER